jgi:DDE_Tnp_1-associated
MRRRHGSKIMWVSNPVIAAEDRACLVIILDQRRPGRASRLPASDRALLSGQCPGLAEYLEQVPDPRNRRGVRHSLTPLLMAAVAAVLAGATSFTAVGEWVADAPPQVLAALGVRRDPLTRRFVPPDEATVRRVLEAADADRLDAAVGSWLDARLHAAGQAAGHGRRRRRAVAVDGKAVRGTRHASADGQPVRLVTITRRHHPAAWGTASAARSLDGSSSPVMTPDHARGNHGMPAELRKLSPLFSQ